MESILVSGGAGYIGSHTVVALLEKGYKPVVLDSLVTGHRQSVAKDVPFFQGDIADSQLVRKIVEQEQISAVIHFAARSLVGESAEKPDLYFEENTAKTNRFVSTLLHCGVKRIIFSSTAATYGIPEDIPIPETAPTVPINPYGFSKLMIEQSFAWLEKAYGLEWIALRYFNAAGAVLDGSLGENHQPETHLIPLILKTALGQRKEIGIFGTDYSTPDGTCIRDYIHVLDLAMAHILALEALAKGTAKGVYNVGTGSGYSVKEVIETARRVTGRTIPAVESPRRPGDPDRLVAKVEKIESLLGWTPRFSSLEQIIESAWAWHRSHPKGYGE
ncbi:UDP-glucose-4-epimerase [Desulfosporosinus orientis DSM 765]|uniref:UDP-glucose 4-epimerase n=1 Tax=Desulfosporosinus orientis (strain ATCC 19365 / DSM 765 / NCIMB 8382 / VKM B-1628 / Singapore I) TaxID=768706 RepID=G7WIL3_DESOD|nr:UDP-glucose 4-epimerase GalE [Desulfosporosinus orientis]AET69087.1 UDP-glucose-4-epimerase [Desulfosporosinus orientis DSM 765]